MSRLSGLKKLLKKKNTNPVYVPDEIDIAVKDFSDAAYTAVKQVEEDMGAYELEISLTPTLTQFEKEALVGNGRFWLICTENTRGIRRYRGTMHPENVRLFVDIGDGFAYVNAQMNQEIPKLEIAREVAKALGAIRILKDGVEVEQCLKQ